jgi:rod shape-determining protein MreC
VFCLAGLFFGSLQSKSLSTNRPDPFNQSVGSLFATPATHVARWLQNCNDFANGLTNASQLKNEVRMLREKELAARLYDDRIVDLEQQIDSLRKNIGLPPVVGRRRIPADVIGYFPSENRITISVGSSKGIQPMMPVVTGEGLVGIIQSVSSTRAQVRLITSLYLRVGAMALRDPPSAGLMRGESADMVILDMLDFSSPVEVGDVVVTSGLSERIPRGILIGKIVKLEDSQEFGTRRATVFPFVHMGNVREVFVLK